MDSYKNFSEKKHKLPLADNLQNGQRQEIAPDQDEESSHTPAELRLLATLERHKAERRMHSVLSQAEEAVGRVVSEGADSRPRGGSLFGKILVALDHSPSGRIVYEQALELAALHRSTLLLLHAFSAVATRAQLRGRRI